MARIGDFREAFLCPDLITAHGAEDSVGFIRWGGGVLLGAGTGGWGSSMQ
jgi:hypothetical protein